MPSPAGAVWKLAVKNWPELVKNWPKIASTLASLVKFVNDNPALPAWLRKRLDELPKRIAAVSRRRGDAERIRGTLDIIRDVARDAHEADPATVDADEYRKRADRIERGVRLAETQARPQQQETLTRLKADTDALLAELIDVVTLAQPRTGGEQPVEAGAESQGGSGAEASTEAGATGSGERPADS